MEELARKTVVRKLEHLTFLPEFPRSVFFYETNRMVRLDTLSYARYRSARLNSSASIKAIFPSRSKGNLLIIDGGLTCFYKIKISISTLSEFEKCMDVIDPRLSIILAVAKTNNFKQYVFDSSSKIWLIEEKKNFTFQTSLVHEWNETELVPSYMTIGAENEYLYISSPTGVWRFNLASLEKKLIIGAGSLTDDGPIDEVNIELPGSLISLNKDVLLIVDEGTQALRVVNLQGGTVSSICAAHDSEKLVEGNISNCMLLKPKFIVHYSAPQNGSIYIGGGTIHCLTYFTIENRCKSYVF